MKNAGFTLALKKFPIDGGTIGEGVYLTILNLSRGFRYSTRNGILGMASFAFQSLFAFLRPLREKFFYL
jgi:hypothetical protein